MEEGDILEQIAENLNQKGEANKDYQVDGDELIEYTLDESEEPVYWSLGGVNGDVVQLHC
ncbi:hypothetical protein BKI52_32970 [marine bacterium AO1-C]|nr:hypothetical protein BKI52_32970 [marine bacterium AO1-C]